MTAILLHDTSERLLTRLKADLPQSLLLTGQEGIGLLTIARWLASNSQLIDTLIPQTTTGQSDSRTGTISIEKIRRLYDQTRAKATTPQIVIIDDAERMSSSAQSAFLKLLEEPNRSTYFILASHYPDKLLPTIRSRVQSFRIQPITAEQSMAHIKVLGVTDPIKQTQLLFIASGLPAELTRLMTNDSFFQKAAVVMADARDLLQAQPYEKLLIIQKYKNSRDGALQLIEAAMKILQRSLASKPHHTLVAQLDQLLTIKEKVNANHNAALHLTRFVL